MLKTVFYRLVVCVALLHFVCPPSRAQEPLDDGSSLADLSLEELMKVTVTSVSRRDERYFEAASAIFVVTAEDIRRSGATSIPEALRMVPGMDVFNIDLNHYHITIRGHNDLVFTDRILVLMDGRAVHSPTFSAVWWPAQNYPMEDIDRIEVILGPGASVWGANAMNGVINIISKKADRTEGTLVSGGAGTREKGFGAFRYGSRTEGGVSYRVYGMGAQTPDSNVVVDEYDWAAKVGRPHANQKTVLQTGMRADWDSGESGTSVIANIYNVNAWSEGTYLASINPPSTPHGIFRDSFAGQNILVRREYRADNGPATSIQLYYDRTQINRITFGEELDTLDGEFQADWRTSDWNLLLAGVNARVSSIRFKDKIPMEMPDSTIGLYGFFAQDEMTFAGDRLKVTPGIKLERNQFTGWEPQPGLRAAWVEDGWMAWAAVSRAVRLPNSVSNRLKWRYSDNGTNSSDGLPIIKQSIGKGGVAPEEMFAYEAGLRLKPSPDFTFNAMAFLNRDRNTVDTISDSSNRTLMSSPTPYWAADYNNYQNLLEGDTYGFELRGDARFQQWIRAFLEYAYTRVQMKPMPGKENSDTLTFCEWINTATPLYSIKGGIFMDLPGHFRVDAMAYYNDRAEDFFYPPTLRLDLRLAYSPSPNLEISVVGRNLTTSENREYQSIESVQENTWVPQDVYFKISYNY